MPNRPIECYCATYTMQLMFSFGLDRFAGSAGVAAAAVAVHFKFKTPIEMEKEENKIEFVCVPVIWRARGTREKLHSMCRFYT